MKSGERGKHQIREARERPGVRPETPRDIRARLTALDRAFLDAGVPRAGDIVTPDEMARVMARLRAFSLQAQR